MLCRSLRQGRKGTAGSCHCRGVISRRPVQPEVTAAQAQIAVTVLQRAPSGWGGSQQTTEGIICAGPPRHPAVTATAGPRHHGATGQLHLGAPLSQLQRQQRPGQSSAEHQHLQRSRPPTSDQANDGC